MSIRSHVRLGIVLLVTWGFAAGSSEAASGRYGAVVIQNPTSNALHFQMRLRDDAIWEDFTVPASTNYEVYFDLDYNGYAYTPNIRFDYVCGDGKDCVTYRYHELDFYEVTFPNWYNGKPYRFEYDDSGNYLDLYTAD